MSVTENTNLPVRSALLPDRHPNHDLFICDVLDAIPKDDMASMEHPIFSLATKPDTRLLRYENNRVSVEIAPSIRGLATIFDKDILIFCISQMIAKRNQGLPLAQTVELNAHELLIWSNRETSGRGYMRLKDAFERLAGTRITTNIKAGEAEITSGFGLIDSWRIVRETKSGRMSQIRVRLSDWMFKMVEEAAVLTLSRDYFRLRKPVERRIYEIARKHCGDQPEWRISLPLLHKKVGASSHDRSFKAMVRDLAAQDHLPDYSVELVDSMVIFHNRMAPSPAPSSEYPKVIPDTFNDAKIVAPGYDVYALEQDWREFWEDSGRPKLDNPDKAFVGFCRSRAKRFPKE